MILAQLSMNQGLGLCSFYAMTDDLVSFIGAMPFHGPWGPEFFPVNEVAGSVWLGHGTLPPQAYSLKHVVALQIVYSK